MNQLNAKEVKNLLSKQSHKNFRIANGKNKQEEKRLELKTKLLEKNANFDDTIWLRDFIHVKQSLADINFSCDYEHIDELDRYQSLSSAAESNRHRSAKPKSISSSARPIRSHLVSNPVKPLSAACASSNYTNRTHTRQTDLTNKYFLFPGILKLIFST